VAFSPIFEDTTGRFVDVYGVGPVEVRDVDERTAVAS
jgi:hypothetical protein